MALQISLVWTSGTTDLDELSLVDFTDGFMPAHNGWVQQVARDGQASVIETMTLQVRATSHDDLAAKIQALDLWKKRVSWSRNTVEVRQVWLRAAIEDETTARQAQILDLLAQPVDVLGKAGSCGLGAASAQAIDLGRPHVDELPAPRQHGA